MPTYAELLAEYKILFPVCVDIQCFCEHCFPADCLFCYLIMAPDADEEWEDTTTIREPPVAAVQSIAAYIAWVRTLPPHMCGQTYSGEGLGDAKAYLESNPRFYGIVGV